MSVTAAGTTAADQQVRLHNGRHHKKTDPFLELSDDTYDQPCPNTKDENGPYHAESLLVDLVLTPINVISLILSLFVVERQARQWRQSQHAPAHNQSFWHIGGPEPYQDAQGSTWHPRLSWRRRGIAKSQMESVLDMRGRVMFALVTWTILGVLAVAYAGRRLYRWTFA